MHRVIVVGSPRANGRSASLADELFNACIDECPEDGVSIVSVASIEVGPCRGCDACRAATEAPDKLPESDDNLAVGPAVAASDALVHRCVIHDDMTEVRKHLDAADELIVVSPVYFAGAPAQLKCLLDRLQPYYWSDVRAQPKRPMVLHVVGEGGDPHGFEPLIGCVRSAFACAGFELELVLDWVGKIDADGEITAEAEEYPLPPVGGFAALDWGDEFEVVEAGDGADDEAPGFEPAREAAACANGGGEARQAEAPARRASSGSRARLSLADAQPQQPPSSKPRKQGSSPQGGKPRGGSPQGGRSRKRKGGARRG
ncbi:NAD(P)H-dependent oxidoreductase [Adlercreutzia sp. ZJ242]|uniref:NAD(P)H-dependent oxidoreductase n=1 Tax=Adlercreutzia sp. ZJ242 TaxID=2709409 RepID=UPI0013EA1C6F|nr:NAD(P)H-dependent oxidoreductase [Adlercreutzia sp. ZJ242]